MKILVIEDSRFLRAAIERMLVKAGHQVIAVGDGQEGLYRTKADRPDVILLDMMLPAMEGTTVLRRLKKDALTKAIPVIVLSGLSQKNERKLKAAGAAAYFEKSALNLDGGKSLLVDAIQRLVAELKDEGDSLHVANAEPTA